MSKARQKRVDTSEVRPDTYIVVVPLTVGEQKDIWRRAQAHKKQRRGEIKTELKEINRNPGPGSELLVKLLTEELDDSDTELSFELGFDLLGTRLLEWNWLGEDGQPLPLPTADDQAVFDLLSAEELGVISSAIAGNTRVTKK